LIEFLGVIVLDEIDRTLLSDLCVNCRVTYEELARKIDLSPNAIKNRVQGLISDGILHTFRATINPEIIHANQFQAIIITNGSENIDEFVDHLGASEMVGHVSILANARGGAYLIWGEYVGTHALQQVTSFLRSQEQVVEVEFHTLVTEGSEPKREFVKLHLKILKHLVENPRAHISDISEKTKLAPKTVRRGLRELTDNQMVFFRARPDLAAEGLVNIHIRIKWDEKLISLEEVAKWFSEKYPIALWSIWISASEPVAFPEFLVRDLQEAEKIAKEIRDLEFVKSSTTLVTFSNRKYTHLGEIALRKMIDDAAV